MLVPQESFLNPDDFVPSLREALEKAPLDLTKFIRVAAAVKDPNEKLLVPIIRDRREIFIIDGEKSCSWNVSFLTDLFRGERPAPRFSDLPGNYEASFLFLELHLLDFCDSFGDLRDVEAEEIYSALRRRPAGKSLGPCHDHLWQASALLLGTHLLSKAEFESILARLERSCRTFAMGSTSRNYINTLRGTIGQAISSMRLSGKAIRPG